MNSSKIEQALELMRDQGVVRPRDLAALGIRRDCLADMCKRGLVERIGRGLYMAAEVEITQHHSLVETAKRVPQGIVCLLSALSYHELTTQNPHQVWLAVDRKGWLPELDLPYVRIVRFSGAALEYGIEEHEIEGVPVRIYSPAKTAADCFKYRNKIGADVALEALRDCWRQRKATMHQLWEAAEACRVARVMRPYLESLV